MRALHLTRLATLAATIPLQLCEHATVTLAAGVQKGGGSAGLAFAFLLAAPATNAARGCRPPSPRSSAASPPARGPNATVEWGVGHASDMGERRPFYSASRRMTPFGPSPGRRPISITAPWTQARPRLTPTAGWWKSWRRSSTV